MIVNLPLIQVLLLKLPLNQGQNNLIHLSRNATFSYLKCQLCRTLCRNPEPARNPLQIGSSIDDLAIGVGGSDFKARSPFQIGFGIDDFGLGVGGPDIDSGGGHGGEGNGGYGSGGNGDQGSEGSEASDGLTGLEWWWLWQWNRAIRTRKRTRTTLHLSYSDRNQLVALVVQMLASEVMPPTDMAEATLATMEVIDRDLLQLLLQLLLFPITFPLVLLCFRDHKPSFETTMNLIFGASAVAVAVLSGAVIYGLWRWHISFRNLDSGEDDTDPQFDDPPVH